jgi:hypothetical protein
MHVGLLGVRYSIVAKKHKWFSTLCFITGMMCYIIQSVDYDNVTMIVLGILVCLFALWHHTIGYLLFLGAWLGYSTFLRQPLISVPTTFFIALECILARELIETPIIYISLLSMVLLGERSIPKNL